MARLKKTEADRAAEQFNMRFCMGLARLDLTNEQMADKLGMHRNTLRRRRENPDMFELGSIRKMGKMFGWTDEDYLSFICPHKEV